MVESLIEQLKKKGLLLTERPETNEQAEQAKTPFVLETMKARRFVFQCDKQHSPAGLLEIAIWVSNPVQKPSDLIRTRESAYHACGMFVYLIEGYWESDGQFQHGTSMYSALNDLLDHLKEKQVKMPALDPGFAGFHDYSSPVAILERAGGISTDVRNITSLYRMRKVSDNQFVKVGHDILRSNDLFGYPIFVSEAM